MLGSSCSHLLKIFIGICALLHGVLTLFETLFPPEPEASEIQAARMEVVYYRVIMQMPDDGYIKVSPSVSKQLYVCCTPFVFLPLRVI